MQGQAEKVPVFRMRTRGPLAQNFEKVSDKVALLFLH